MKSEICFLDLFAGAGGLSEGFIREDYLPIAHIESDSAACFTLKTRMAFHYLKKNKKEDIYIDYITGKMSRSEFYSKIPENILESIINKEISEINLDSIFFKIDSLLSGKKLDIIIGGPPCQAYSVIGRSRDKHRMKNDKRNYLYIFYAEFLKKYQPEYFVFENVTGLLSAKDKNKNLFFDNMIKTFSDAGYKTEYKIISAEEYGIPQKRKRVILIGKKGKEENFYPLIEKENFSETVGDILSDLPSLKAGEGNVYFCKAIKYSGKWLYEKGIKNDSVPITWHIARNNNEQDLEIYRIAVALWNKSSKRLDYNSLPEKLKTHKQRKAFTDRFKVVASNLNYSHTVVAHIAKDGHYYIHPDIDQNRSLTPREAARIQTFPDDYYFESASGNPAKAPAFRQIGNAVPVVLAQKIAKKIKEVFI